MVTPKCDVSSLESITRVLDECGTTMPPVRGCINAAMELNVSCALDPRLLLKCLSLCPSLTETIAGLHLRQHDP